MRSWTKNARSTIGVEVLLFDQFSNHCLANTVEPLRAMNTIAGRKLYDWRYVSIGTDSVTSSSGLPVATDKLTDKEPDISIMFVMPSYGYRQLSSPAVLQALRRADARSHTMAAMDTGAWLLAAAGLLEGKSATIHSTVLEEFSETFPGINILEDRFVIDGNCITCGGSMAAFDLTMHLIALHHGEAQRMSVEGYFLFQGSELPRSKTEVPLKSHLLQQALKLMDEHLETPLAIGQIAGRLNCNQKYLQRKFVSALGASPAKVYQHKRLNHAKTLLLRSDLSVVEVAVRCGYENTSSMIRSFRNHFGTTPLAYRNALTGR